MGEDSLGRCTVGNVRVRTGVRSIIQVHQILNEKYHTLQCPLVHGDRYGKYVCANRVISVALGIHGVEQRKPNQ